MATRANPPPPKRLANGVVVPPNLQVNELTLNGLRHYHGFALGRTLTRAEALAAGFDVLEIEREYGVDNRTPVDEAPS